MALKQDSGNDHKLGMSHFIVIPTDVDMKNSAGSFFLLDIMTSMLLCQREGVGLTQKITILMACFLHCIYF